MTGFRVVRRSSLMVWSLIAVTTPVVMSRADSDAVAKQSRVQQRSGIYCGRYWSVEPLGRVGEVFRVDAGGVPDSHVAVTP
jgi:hypothetical protein